MSEVNPETSIRPAKIPTELLHISKRNPNRAILIAQQRTGRDVAAAVSDGIRSAVDVEQELFKKAQDFQTNPAAEEMAEVLFANYADKLAIGSVQREGLTGVSGPEINRRANNIYTYLQREFRRRRLQKV
ncbi:MAG: hypothetical protein A3C30_01400 [Candidatus Levybacteria bacterium RIFCSPHIGHO2_02_FULL_40_18]|nr:MAG: hypothetical protein A2869_00965 [Candidatus Levybacteria bacterium RIFCSPHIGHO2_01_FULL_40_58]OGH26652.1 MAG: hypothetical protein A3C30_01400 [Candidatus Levybacteria bacterium RIFCSPHIGHO2_02_FULL_40_18]OGH31181.1 MAG: hypothetical protein A3E43_00235 [Candidatus Levybacteria bacterium RIFCSPHIGHO2_12_FULL_40_31]OGH39863.1 MAG: hypothetical protein A2894_03740 [Candidatus Levybacteria bacterium RIFCSPLOWO2_01_FULL_40_64]OGH48887.1 MAG: hypothetical protein A3I54_04845 [Candidatus Lev